ncbi:hypothetical protein HDU81_011103 [Chytriomyces hyalinus]|nr:hypothetical protein HDU81_011103 [Chytriomyces hyalinus]
MSALISLGINAKFVPVPANRLARWQEAVTAMAFEKARENSEKLKEKDTQMLQMKREHDVQVQMLMDKVAAVEARRVEEVHSLRLDCYMLSREIHEWEQKSRNFEHFSEITTGQHLFPAGQACRQAAVQRGAGTGYLGSSAAAPRKPANPEEDCREGVSDEGKAGEHAPKESAKSEEDCREGVSDEYEAREPAPKEPAKSEEDCREGVSNEDGAGEPAQHEHQAAAGNIVSPREFSDQHRRGDYISEGADGKVHKAVKRSNGGTQVCAVKRVSLVRMGLSRLLSELKIGLGLKCRHVVPVREVFYEADTATGEPYVLFTMELMRVSLWEVLSRWGAFQESTAALVMGHILAGVKYLHSTHVLHGDLKPGNVMVSMDGVVKISDFGASVCDVTNNHLVQLWGTGRYMAREVLTGKGYGLKADMWSVGVMLHDILSGSGCITPECETVGRLLLHYASVSLGPSFSGSARDFVSRCLSIAVDARMSAEDAEKHPFLSQQCSFYDWMHRLNRSFPQQ